MSLLQDAETLTGPVMEGVECRDLSGGKGWEIGGLIAPYNRPAMTIEGYAEEYAPGSLTRTIQQRGHKVRLYSMHTEGVLQPIGIAAKYRDSAEGMRAAFRMPKTTAAADARELVKAGISTGLSISFSPLRSSQQMHDSFGSVTRRDEMALKHVALSPIQTYPDAQVEHVRSGQPPEDSRHLPECLTLDCPGCAPTPRLDHWRTLLAALK